MGIGIGWLGRAVVMNHGDCTVKADTVWQTDTMLIAMPAAGDSMVVRYVTRMVPVVGKPCNDLQGTVAEGVHDTISTSAGGLPGSCDSAEVILPIQTKKYSNENYTAWVSGYEASLDSIQIYSITQTVTKTAYLDKKRRRWACVAGIGIGSDMKGRVTPHIGLMLGYSLFR